MFPRLEQGEKKLVEPNQELSYIKNTEWVKQSGTHHLIIILWVSLRFTHLTFISNCMQFISIKKSYE